MREAGGVGGGDRIERGEAFKVAGCQGALKDGRGREGGREGGRGGGILCLRVGGCGRVCIRVCAHCIGSSRWMVDNTFYGNGNTHRT